MRTFAPLASILWLAAAGFAAGCIESRHSRNLDSDRDGLPDWFEQQYGAQGLALNPALADTDGNGVLDGDEDPDGDGLTNLVELGALGAEPVAPFESAAVSPAHADLLVEVDWMAGQAPGDGFFDWVFLAFDSLPLDNPDGSAGIHVHLYADEQDLPLETFADSVATRDYLAVHGPSWADPPAHVAQMVHALLAWDDALENGGSRGYTLYDSATMNLARTGAVLLDRGDERAYQGLLVCGAAQLPNPIDLQEVRAVSLVHELGHALQVDHETDVIDGWDYFNVMLSGSDQHTCLEQFQRFRGTGNPSDRSLGANETDGFARFRDASAAHIDLLHKVSVDVAVQLSFDPT